MEYRDVPSVTPRKTNALQFSSELIPPSSAEVKECEELYLHFPNTSLWHGV